MISYSQSRVGLVSGIVLGLALALGAPQQAAAQGLRCLPSCSTVDARFLAISGSSLANLSESTLNLSVSVPAGTTSFTLGFFDGDANSLDGSGISHWDTSNAAVYEYTLYADPLGNGAGSTLVEWSPGVTTLLSTSMPDNAWIDYTINNSLDAQTPSGNFFYRLHIVLTTPLVITTNAFKVRTSAVLSGVTLNPTFQPFSFIANLRGLADLQIVYPAYPSVTPTNYDGSFRFYFDLPTSRQHLTVWDGDFDRGKFDGTDLDTDDPDTPGIPFLPPWSTPATLFEGVAVGAVGTTGNPPDDRTTAGAGIYNSKPPSVTYTLLFPDGQTFFNENPSGNLEWEQFRISTDPFDPSQMDYSTTVIPAGVYELRTAGSDMQNLTALLLPFRLLCVGEDGVPCQPLRPFLVGDTVFLDGDGDGVQGPDEPGIAGVELELVDSLGAVLATVTTDADGRYSFPVEVETYTVRIADSNSDPGGPLDGAIATTPVQVTETVVDDNVLTYDFGYRGTGSIGDRLWFDLNGDGAQDSGEGGINGATVELLDGDGNVVASTTTSGDGDYSFDHLFPGSYSVRVVTATLPEGLEATYDLDGTGTPDAAEATLEAGEDRTDVDFGYRGTGSIGDRLWYDLDGDGAQDGGEAGLNGVTVRLLDGDGNTVATTTTATNGNYTFDNLPAGDFTVEVDSTTLPAGAVPTFDLDGTGTAHRAAVTLAAGEDRTDVDFGYRGNSSLGDRLWLDLDGDGVQDGGEGGLNGTSVELLDGDGNVIATTATSGDGNYTFASLLGGTYSVRVVAATLPPGAVQTYDLDGTGTANIATVTLAAGTARTDVDFGYRGNSSLGDRVWYDVDGDGVQDAGEAGLNGVTVELLNGGGTVIATTTTAGNGNYSFANLNAGTYTVRVVSATLPPGAAQTYDLDGTGTAHIATVTLATGASRTDVDFGYRGNASLGDRVWLDSDGDGVQDSGETGLNGVTVELLDGSGAVISSIATSGDGNYVFAGLLGGTYSVRVVAATLPAGAAQTYDLDGTGTAHIATVILATGANRTDVDFGYRVPVVCTAGYFKDHFNTASFSNNDGTLSWSGAWIESDVAGTGVSSGNVTVGSPYSGYLFLRDSPDTGTQPSAARQVNLSSFTSATLSFSFHVRTAVDPDDSVTVEVSNDGGASYTVLETLNGFSGTYTGSRSYDISSYIASNTRIRFRVSNNYGAGDEIFKLDWVKIDAGCTNPPPQNGSIGNRVWNDGDGDGSQDSGESGINGVTVQLLNSSGTVIATTTTAGNGDYTFGNLAAGSYSVRIVTSTLPAGVVQTYDLDGTATAHIAAVTLASGQNRTDADFGYRTPPACTAGYFKDHFSSASFSNNDGTLSWTGAWIESDVAGTGVSSGNVTVGSPYSGYLFLRDYPDTGTQPSAAREANLSGFASATLSFSFHVRTAVDPDDAVAVEVSNNGGASYTVLETLSGFSGTYTGSRSYDISAFIAGNTRIRFRVSNNYGAGDELFKLDWVKIDGSCAPTPPSEAPGTGTIGYWKTHPEDWPVEQITAGGKTYTKSQAISWLGTSSRGDKTIDLFKQLVAAKLNVLVGNEASCISSTISSADTWLVYYPLGSKVKASSSAWSTGGPLHTKLDDYNNGELCAPHRD